MVRFQKLTRNLFLTLHGHNVHRQHLLRRHFWHVQFPACSSHWLVGTSQKRLTHSFNVVIRYTRSTRTLAFTQASSFHKLSVPPSYVILVWCVCSKPCTKLTLHCNHRSEHLKTKHTESLFLLRRHLGNRRCSKHEKRTDGSAWETWTVAAADGVRFARVRWEINFLLIFETAPFFCKHPVYKLLYFNFFSSSLCTTFLSAGTAISISVHVFTFSFLIIICGLFALTSLSVCTAWFHNTVTSCSSYTGLDTCAYHLCVVSVPKALNNE